jgi:hypothetical protein
MAHTLLNIVVTITFSDIAFVVTTTRSILA